MAVLWGDGRDSINFKRLDRWLRISPVPPSVEGPRDAYEITCGPDWTGTADIDLSGDVYGWQFNHMRFEDIAEVFIQSGTLQRVRKAAGIEQRFSFHVWVDWLHIIIDDEAGGRRGERISVALFASKQDKALHPEQYRYSMFYLNTTSEAAHQFGDELLAELRQARLVRKSLGLQTEEDDVFLLDEEELRDR